MWAAGTGGTVGSSLEGTGRCRRSCRPETSGTAGVVSRNKYVRRLSVHSSCSIFVRWTDPTVFYPYQVAKIANTKNLIGVYSYYMQVRVWLK